MAVMTFVIRGESILLGFLKGFFSQEKLFGNFPNQFQYIDNKDGLFIGLSEPDNEVTPAPAIIIQEGGFHENIRTMNSNMSYQELISDKRYYQSEFIHPYTIHCIGRKKGEAKLLQSALTKAVIVFRRAIYEMGVDNISPLQGQPPTRFSAADKQAPSQLYDCGVNFQMSLAQQWVVSRVPGEDGYVDYEELVKFTITAALEEIEFDSNGNPLAAPEDYIQIIIKGE